MKSVELKTKEIVAAYAILSKAKYQKLSDEDKISIWKVMKALKPTAAAFDEESKDAQKQFSPYEDFANDCNMAAQYIVAKKAGSKDLPMTEEQYKRIDEEFGKYKALIDKALAETKEKPVTIEFKALSEDAFSKLMASNDWTLSEVNVLEFIVE